jgi:hypothetical protein
VASAQRASVALLLASLSRAHVLFLLATNSLSCLAQKQTASLTSRIETEMAGRASRGGPLTIMKGAADGAAKERAEAEKKRKEKAAKP